MIPKLKIPHDRPDFTIYQYGQNVALDIISREAFSVPSCRGGGASSQCVKLWRDASSELRKLATVTFPF